MVNNKQINGYYIYGSTIKLKRKAKIRGKRRFFIRYKFLRFPYLTFIYGKYGYGKTYFEERRIKNEIN